VAGDVPQGPASERHSSVGFLEEEGVREPEGVAAIVAGLVEVFAEIQGGFALLVTTLRFTLRGRLDVAAVAAQMYEIGNRSLVFLAVVMGFIGMILVYQAGLQMLRVVPDLSQLGATYLQLLVSELGPTLCALMLATRVGAGIAAEIGSMVVTEQVDALRMCAADPVDFLVKPRFVASLAMTLMLGVVATAVAFTTGMATAAVFFQVNPHTFANLSVVGPGDLITALVKCIAYGAAVPVVSAYCGLTTYGGSEGVGRATTRAVVSSSLTVIVLDFSISAVGYVLRGG
jgi:phospholipid/cholesterol/gamma-HCH transport system permease protein